MPITQEAHATTPVVVERAKRATKPRRHQLEEHPPPPMRAFSIDQIEDEHPGVKGRLRQWIKRADAGDPEFAWLKFCVIRVARSVLIDDVRFRDSLHQRTAIPAAVPRNPRIKPQRRWQHEAAPKTTRAAGGRLSAQHRSADAQQRYHKGHAALCRLEALWGPPRQLHRREWS